MADVIDFIDQVINQDFSKAAPTFDELMKDRMNTALEQEKIAVAGQIFNGAEEAAEEDDVDEDDDFDDEDLDDNAEEALDEEDEEEDFEEE